MKTLTDQQRSALVKALHAMDQAGVRYAVLRRHERLPDAVPGDPGKPLDVDILVDATRLDAVVVALERLGFRIQVAVYWTWLGLLQRAASAPLGTALLMLKSPGKVVRSVVRPLQHKSIARQSSKDGTTKDAEAPAANGNGRLRTLNRLAAEKAYALHMDIPGLGLALDLKTHLSHVSPLDGSRIRVEPIVETWMLERRVRRDGISHAAPADEIAHVVAHCVFEYEGKFPKYYVDRLKHLVPNVVEDAEQERHLSNVLDVVFYRAGPMVMELVRKGDFNLIRESLFRFHDY